VWNLHCGPQFLGPQRNFCWKFLKHEVQIYVYILNIHVNNIIAFKILPWLTMMAIMAYICYRGSPPWWIGSSSSILWYLSCLGSKKQDLNRLTWRLACSLHVIGKIIIVYRNHIWHFQQEVFSCAESMISCFLSDCSCGL
jgi:hypothetical protein